MKVTVVGAGYVGLSTAFLCLEQGYDVHIVDWDESRVRDLKNRYCYIDTPHFKDLLVKHYDRLSFGFDHVDDVDIVFCCVSTPLGEDGQLDMRFFDSAVRSCPKDIIFVQRSTCMPGTAEKYLGLFNCYLVMPEFLREKTAWEDSVDPDRVVVGVFGRAVDLLGPISTIFDVLGYEDDGKVFVLSLLEAELVKLVANSFLATKISFASAVELLCRKLGSNTENVLGAVGEDSRIGHAMFRLDGGFGGACLPKDTSALSHIMEDNLLGEVLDVNDSVRGD